MATVGGAELATGVVPTASENMGQGTVEKLVRI